MPVITAGLVIESTWLGVGLGLGLGVGVGVGWGLGLGLGVGVGIELGLGLGAELSSGHWNASGFCMYTPLIPVCYRGLT